MRVDYSLGVARMGADCSMLRLWGRRNEGLIFANNDHDDGDHLPDILHHAKNSSAVWLSSD